MANVETGFYSTAQAPDFIGAAANGLKLRDMVRQQQIADRAQNFQNTLKGAYQQDPQTGQLTFDNSKLKDLAQIDPEKAYAMQVQMRQQALEQQKANMELHHVQLGDMAQILGKATDEPSYQLAVKEATDKGYLHAGELPDSYAAASMKGPNGEPSAIDAHRNQALTYQEQISNSLKGREVGAAEQTASAKKSQADTAAAELPIKQGELAVKKQQAANEGKKLDVELGNRDYSQGKDLVEHLQKGWAARSGATGDVQMRLNAADRAQQLIDQGKGQKGGLDQRQVGELAMSTAALLGGGAATDAKMNELLPETAVSKGMGWKEYLQNAPQGAELQAFTDRLAETTQRERALAVNQKRQFQVEGLPQFEAMKGRDPEGYWRKLRAAGIKPEMIDQNGQYKAPVGTPGGPPLSQQDALAEAKRRGLIK